MNSSSVIKLLDCAPATEKHPSKVPARSKTAREFPSNRYPFRCFSHRHCGRVVVLRQKLYTKQSQGVLDAFGCRWSRMAPPSHLLLSSIGYNPSRLGAARPTIQEALARHLPTAH